MASGDGHGYAIRKDRDFAIAPCSDPDTRFIDWAFGRTDRLIHALEIDAIATWRLALSSLPFPIVRLRHGFDHWLPRSGMGAAIRHCPIPAAA